MSIIIKDIDMPLGCVYEDEKGNTQYCPLCNHEDIPYCTLELINMPMEGLHFIEIDSRPEWCLLSTFEEPRKGKITYTECCEELWGESSICSLCGCSWQIAENGNDNFCPNCGADMRSEAREYLEYGKLIAKGIAQGLRGDSDD